ncbi:hypothetical protein LTR53_008401 [Teratosphaeriaceae sp. CCFEE 6253]|nr:hypothetical protein LTR53_008401 [Teratosphaeriaceae sp. CCFEE 6253]
MFWAMIWSLSAAFGSLLVGGLLVYLLRNTTSTRSPAEWPGIEKTACSDEAAAPSDFAPGSPISATTTASDSDTIDRGQGTYNVVVINKELEYRFDVEGIVERHEVDYYEPPDGRRIPYDVIVFREGVLYNLGDGGDINWDWMGNFRRSGISMLTFKPCEGEAGYVQDPWLATAGQKQQHMSRVQ